ncbi:hypothetical protein RCC89_03435 [Cytophagaceae bacterium ABcell3]|nr:hypothetical protein RCC89_03435 [Cytophagaceae bacterium ABcell3]
MGQEAIIDKDGNWDLLDRNGDDRINNANYKKIIINPFLRIPYDYIVDYDMEPDPYNAIPTLFVEYAKDGMPYEEIVYGYPGIFNKDDEFKSKFTHYLDNNKRLRLK